LLVIQIQFETESFQNFFFPKKQIELEVGVAFLSGSGNSSELFFFRGYGFGSAVWAGSFGFPIMVGCLGSRRHGTIAVEACGG